MSEAPAPSAAAYLPLQQLPVAARWAVLLAASILSGGILHWAKLPAALMLGPLLAAVLVQMTGGAVKVYPIPATAKNPYFYIGANCGEGYLNTNSQLFGTTQAPAPMVRSWVSGSWLTRGTTTTR